MEEDFDNSCIQKPLVAAEWERVKELLQPSIEELNRALSRIPYPYPVMPHPASPMPAKPFSELLSVLSDPSVVVPSMWTHSWVSEYYYKPRPHVKAVDCGWPSWDAFAPFKAARIEMVGPRVDLSKFPHTCPRCKAPAYVGFVKVECSQNCKGEIR